MYVSPNWYKLKGYMEAEKALMNRFSKENSQVLKLVKQKNWVILQEQLRVLGDISERIEALEKKRHLCFQTILIEGNHKSSSSLSDLLEELPLNISGELKKLKHHLAITAERIAIENKTLDSYVEAHNRTIKEIMGELIPETRGQLYSPEGRLKENRLATQSLLVNHSL